MEETIKLFKSFLAHVSWAEHSLDQYRALICQHTGAKVDLFKLLDQERKGYITPEDMCQFYGNKNGSMFKVMASIVERYFHFSEGVLTIDEFIGVLKPKDCHGVVPEPDQNPFETFHHMIRMVVECYFEIEKVRVRLFGVASVLQNYFCYRYHSGKFLTRNTLKYFMQDCDHYTPEKFQHICSYIFGDETDQVLWDNIFGASQQEYMLNQTPENSAKKSRIYYLLQQIDDVDKMEGFKRLRRNYSELIQIPGTKGIKTKQSGSNFEGTRKTGMIKRNLPQTFQYEPDYSLIQRSYVPQLIPSDMKQNSHRVRSYPNFDSYRDFLMEDYVPKSLLQKSSTQAQLKIDEIQRRTLEKYFIQDSYDPYMTFSWRNYEYPYLPRSAQISQILTPRTKYSQIDNLQREIRHYDLLSRSSRLPRY